MELSATFYELVKTLFSNTQSVTNNRGCRKHPDSIPFLSLPGQFDLFDIALNPFDQTLDNLVQILILA